MVAAQGPHAQVRQAGELADRQHARQCAPSPRGRVPCLTLSPPEPARWSHDRTDHRPAHPAARHDPRLPRRARGRGVPTPPSAPSRPTPTIVDEGRTFRGTAAGPRLPAPRRRRVHYTTGSSAPSASTTRTGSPSTGSRATSPAASPSSLPLHPGRRPHHRAGDRPLSPYAQPARAAHLPLSRAPCRVRGNHEGARLRARCAARRTALGRWPHAAAGAGDEMPPWPWPGCSRWWWSSGSCRPLATGPGCWLQARC